VNCICVNKQWYISFAEEGEEGKKEKEKTMFPSSWPQKKQQR
jgi:hypothetical protein